ncbi:hypothetical protein [Streptomyces endophyticus]|uniref:Uncharacterized protein n=1 Tax=Streptomyces endophyticus TaxID=714166 RepID=A0ABU6FBW7_9ACTN|nr:hypothetical protein [Streptomyces endophyticus]MEB8341525.1 hypothetical protein [Streptomyces endophyticus]
MTQPPHIPDGNPYAKQPQQPPQQPQYGYPQQQPYAPFPQQQGMQGMQGGFHPVPPPAPARGNAGLGILAGFVAMLVIAGAYGGLVGAIEREIGYAAVAVGVVVGFVAGKVGGNNPVVLVVSPILSLVGVYLGQLLGESVIGSKVLPFSVPELLFQHFDWVHEAWKTDSDAMTFLFFALAAIASFGATKRASA